MKAHGNGTPETCVSNLLRIVRGEIPFDRVRGRDSTLIDRPHAADDAIADAEWLLETYEPRVTAESAELIAESAINGDFYAHINTKRREDEDK